MVTAQELHLAVVGLLTVLITGGLLFAVSWLVSWLRSIINRDE